MIREDGTYLLNADTEFRSSSGAASIVVGGNTNGLKAWKVDGRTLSEYKRGNI